MKTTIYIITLFISSQVLFPCTEKSHDTATWENWEFFFSLNPIFLKEKEATISSHAQL